MTLESSRDPLIVDWEPNDPDRPLNWTRASKWRNISIVSLITLLTPLASSMIAPAVIPLMHEFHSTNSIIASFVVSIYIVGYAVGPLVLAPLSEMYGRLYLYHVNNVLFVIWTVACALAPNIPAMLIFRLMCGLAGSCSLTIGGGTITDVFVQQERGLAMSLFSMGPILGPIVGPVGGGFLAEAAGWRWIFWLLAIAAGVVTLIAFVFLRETYEPAILEKRARRLRKETGNMAIRSKQTNSKPKAEVFKQALIRPTKMLFMSPIVAIMSIYVALIYSYLYFFFTTLSQVFEEQYHWGSDVVGLSFLGLGVGSIIGVCVFGAISDKILKRLSAGGEMKPEYRLPPLLIGTICIPTGFIWYGWTAEKRVHWIAPIIGTGFVGIGQIATFMPVVTYLIDSFPHQAASVVAANTVLRSLGGAFIPLAGPSLFDALGLGWGNSLLGFIALLMIPITLLTYKYGEKIRTHPRFQVEF
ncbi:MFS general substrate transporter [Zopfia rhizophila CBS 207.26]|uniref:MFS general substrate transporter n=1 Tax=Zopfia rhizophila CBS 207.26 TaxID=1314779 RepID=A0A6A6DFW7_9PEZI|nr:MFS general substrate transporter [Zopfia rhizophila CBS 207.26]